MQQPQSWLGRDKVINSPVKPYSVVLSLNCNQAGRRLHEGWEGETRPQDWGLGLSLLNAASSKISLDF